MVYKSIAAKRKERQASLIFTGSHVEEKGCIKKGKAGRREYETTISGRKLSRSDIIYYFCSAIAKLRP